MGRRNVYSTSVDQYTREVDLSLKKLADAMGISTSTLLKVRALNIDRNRGMIHWTSLVMIGVHMGIFNAGDIISPDNPKLRKLAPTQLRTTRGRGAPQYWYRYQ